MKSGLKQLGGDFYSHTTLESFRYLRMATYYVGNLFLSGYISTVVPDTAPKLNNKGVLSHGTKIASYLAFGDNYTLINLSKILDVRLAAKHRPKV